MWEDDCKERDAEDENMLLRVTTTIVCRMIHLPVECIFLVDAWYWDTR